MAGSQYEGFLKTPDENEYIPLLEHTTCIKRWDISPELRGAHDFAKYTRSKGIMTAVTHTEAEYDEIKAAYAVGFSHAAHFTMQCRVSTNAVNINMKGRWRVYI